jgi:hypothetical protein
MDSSKSCTTREHCLELQQDQMHKQHANDSFIKHESRLVKQNDYAHKKCAKESIII